jgi:Protein of unknown function (DUF2752).
MSVDPAPPAVEAEVAPSPRWRRMVAPASVAGLTLAATVALHFRDPHVAGSWGMCPSAALGFWCPGCGGLRAVNALTNVQVVDAASSNLLFVASIPLILYVFVRWSTARYAGRAWQPSMRAQSVSAIALVVLLAAFMLLRNLPAGTWLAP